MKIIENSNLAIKENLHTIKGCDYCVLPSNYKSAYFSIDDSGKCQCNYCKNHVVKTFKGKEALIKDIDLQKNEKIGIMVSGGKDGLFAWMTLCDLFGSENVIAFNYHKTGLVHPLAVENIKNASKLLNNQVIIVEDKDFIERFKKNLRAFIDKPDPSMVRVALCAGCRYGITGNLYELAYKKYNIKKFVSAASYLELAPFKNELLKEKGNGNSKYGLIKGLGENPAYNFDKNIEIILRDDNLTYKTQRNSSSVKSEFSNYQLIDFDDYFPNIPSRYESEVKKRLNWQCPKNSWRFDCIIESFKDFFYYGLLGYTETDYKISEMIRYKLIDREKGLIQVKDYHKSMNESIDSILNLLEYLNLDDLKNKFITFYLNSPYFESTAKS